MTKLVLQLRLRQKLFFRRRCWLCSTVNMVYCNMCWQSPAEMWGIKYVKHRHCHSVCLGRGGKRKCVCVLLCVYVHEWMCVCACLCVCVCVCMLIYVCMWVFVHLSMCICLCAGMCARLCMYCVSLCAHGICYVLEMGKNVHRSVLQATALNIQHWSMQKHTPYTHTSI